MRLNVVAPPALARRVVPAPAAKAVATAPVALAQSVRVTSASSQNPFATFAQGIVDTFRGFFVSFVGFKTRKIEDDPSDVNHPNYGEDMDARKALAAQRGAEQSALGKLSQAQQTQYNTVVKAIGDRPQARQALQALLVAGTLPGSAPLRGQGDALTALATLTNAPLADGIERAKLLSEMLCELENPVRINQQHKGTCAATTAQILLIRRHPAEYVRLVTDLAAPAGTATMAGGGTLTRDPDWANANDGDRSTASRLIQPAIMDAAEGIPFAHYKNAKDMPFIGPVPMLLGGMTPGGAAKVNTQLEGVKYKNVGFMFGNREAHFQKVKDALAAGLGSVPVGVMWSADGAHGGHELQVDKVADGRVYYTNPWGQRESMEEHEFLDHMTAAAIPTA
ncbi:MAG: hypothetical protein JWM80_5165 [Cyanobacteria bacterium RYN_339]|nr:hypothetical protein [Cyanobacteria bacterium RYN_339]